MGLLEPYVGNYVSARSATEYIDIGSIISGCNAAISEAGQLQNVAIKVNEITAMVDVKALSVDGLTIQGNSEECCNSVVSAKGEIESIASSIITAAENAYNSIQQQLNEEAYQNECIMAAQRRAS